MIIIINGTPHTNLLIVKENFISLFWINNAPVPTVLIVSADTPTQIEPNFISENCMFWVKETAMPTKNSYKNAFFSLNHLRQLLEPVLFYTARLTQHTKFLGLQIDNHLNWKNHIDQIVPKLSGACYAVRSMSHVSNTVTLKAIYFAYFHSIMKYGIIF
jgi:hypothetical protein